MGKNSSARLSLQLWVLLGSVAVTALLSQHPVSHRVEELPPLDRRVLAPWETVNLMSWVLWHANEDAERAATSVAQDYKRSLLVWPSGEWSGERRAGRAWTIEGLNLSRAAAELARRADLKSPPLPDECSVRSERGPKICFGWSPEASRVRDLHGRRLEENGIVLIRAGDSRARVEQRLGLPDQAEESVFSSEEFGLGTTWTYEYAESTLCLEFGEQSLREIRLRDSLEWERHANLTGCVNVKF